MAQQKAWSEEEDRFVINALKSGNGLREISRLLGRSEKAVRNRCSRLHIDVCTVKSKQNVKSFDYVDVRCPFFDKFYRGKSIKCEGIDEGGYIVVGFSSVERWMNHIRFFCNSEYIKCPFATMLYNKYEEKNKI